MSDFLTDTLVSTGALLLLVLLIRRPVAAVFGPKAAYALWALPMGRLLLPPLVLPAWMAPASEPAVDAAFHGNYDPAFDAPFDSGHAALDGSMATSLEAPAQIAPEPSLFAPLAGFDWASFLIPIWLAGAAVFLIRRYALYFEMRRELLAAARPMGEAGRVRLVETPAADGPVAFGVLDKVIALPPGFMAGRDRTARDLALTHELAHHRGHDLLCNMLVQPLFALHWFNPLSLFGWRALRRDQEAACDARVMGHAPRESRAAYAAVIARFATQPRTAARLALAAPMACPVLGDRSIVQRLKSLTMTDISARRRWSGRLLIAGAALALPLTGSISYAQSDLVLPPAPPAPAPAPPAPASPPAAVTAPLPPAPPAPPSAIAGEDGSGRTVRIERIKLNGHKGEGTKHVYFKNGNALTEEERADFEEDMKDSERDMAEHRRDMAQGAAERSREYAQEMEEHRRDMAELHRDLAAERGHIDREVRIAVADARAEAHAAIKAAPRVTERCRKGQKNVTETVIAKDGRQHIFVCTAVAMTEARKAIAVARADIARARHDVANAHGMNAHDRAQALRGLDQAERELRAN